MNISTVYNSLRKAILFLPLSMLVLCITSYALNQAGQKQVSNQVLGEVAFVGKTKAEKTAGVWIDGQYVGYIAELRDDKKVLLLPGEHEISVRQTGYVNFTEKVTVEPAKKLTLPVTLQKDPQAQFPAITSQIKLKVTPERAAVFLDDAFVGTVHEFSGVGRALLVSPGKHRVKIALAGYQGFETEVNLRPHQKIKINTDLLAGSSTQAEPVIKKP